MFSEMFRESILNYTKKKIYLVLKRKVILT